MSIVIYRCIRVDHQSVSLFSNVFINILGKGSHTSSMSVCLKRAHGKTTENMFPCTQPLHKTCLSSRVRIIKTIRTKMPVARKLLEELPNLKIVHLVRDPRAVLQSQSHLGKCNTGHGGIEGCTNRLCIDLENNLVEEELIMRDYPNRILPVLYEEIAKHPIETSQKLYEFAGYEFTDTIKEYVFNTTLAGEGNTYSYSTKRSNSSEHVDNWKNTMNQEFRNYVQTRCNYIIKHYKYDLV